MSYREENVPRGDNVPQGERKENEQRSEHRAEPGMDSADHRGREAHVDDVNVEPGEAEVRRGTTKFAAVLAAAHQQV